MCTYDIREDDTVPGSLESMGYTVDAYWEEQHRGGSRLYPKATVRVERSSLPLGGEDAHNGPDHDCSASSHGELDCTALDEVRRALDGSSYRVPRLRVKLKEPSAQTRSNAPEF